MTIQELQQAVSLMKRAVKIATILRLGGTGQRVAPQLKAMNDRLVNMQAMMANAKTGQDFQALQAQVDQLKAAIDALVHNTGLELTARTWACLDKKARLVMRVRRAALVKKLAGGGVRQDETMLALSNKISDLESLKWDAEQHGQDDLATQYASQIGELTKKLNMLVQLRRQQQYGVTTPQPAPIRTTAPRRPKPPTP